MSGGYYSPETNNRGDRQEWRAAHRTAVLRQVHRLFNIGAVGTMSDAQLLDRFVSRRDRGRGGGLRGAGDPARPDGVPGLPKRSSRLRMMPRMPFRPSSSSWPTGPGRSVGAGRSRAGCSASRERVAIRGQADGRAPACARPARRRADLRKRSPDGERSRLGDPPRGDRPLARAAAAPIVLCYLQGLTYAAAAHQLGLSEVAIRGRLARARERLRHRLTRRGVTVPAGLLAAGAAAQAQAAIPVDVDPVHHSHRAGIRGGQHGRHPGAGGVEFHAAQPRQGLGRARVRSVSAAVTGLGMHLQVLRMPGGRRIRDRSSRGSLSRRRLLCRRHSRLNQTRRIG